MAKTGQCPRSEQYRERPRRDSNVTLSDGLHPEKPDLPSLHHTNQFV